MTGTNDKLRALVLAVLMVTSVFAGTIALAGTAAAQAGNDGGGEDSLNTGTTDARFWQGQELVINDPDLAGQTLELYTLDRDNDEPGDYAQGDFVGQVSIDQDGEANVETSNLEGSYALYGDNGPLAFTDGDSSAAANDGEARFSVTPQTLSAEFDDSEVEDDESTELLLDSNRATYQVNISSDQASFDDLEDIFGPDANDDEDEYTLNVTSNDAEIEADFTDVDTGDYTFDIEVADTGVTASAETTVVEADENDANFASSAFSEARGDIVEFTIELSETDDATVFIGSDDVNYLAELDVEDDDDDDEVTVEFNTFRPGANAAFGSEDDTVQVVNVTDGEGGAIPVSADPLDASDYDLNVSVAGDEKDVATLALTEATISAFQIWTAPEEDLGDLDDEDAVNEALADGSITRANAVATGDAVVHRVEANGIFGALELVQDANADVGNNEQALVFLNNTAGAIELRFKEANPGPNTDGLNVSLNNSQVAGALEVVSDEENDSLYVIADSQALVDAGFDEDEEVNVTFKVREEESGLVDENVQFSRTFEIVEPTAEFDSNAENEDGDEIVQVEAGADQEVTGTTNVAPGTDVTVRARATGDSPFLLSNETEVTQNGTFAATFDFTNVSAGQEFELSISSPSRISPSNVDDAEIDGVVAAGASANVTISNQSGDGSSVTVDSVTMSDGGFVTIHDATLLEGDALGSVLGTSEYLENGTSTDVTVTLNTTLNETQTVIAMPHQDTNDNQQYDFVTSEGAADGPYTGADGAVTDSATYNVSSTNMTATPTPSEPGTTTPAETTAPPATTEPGMGTTEPPATDPPTTAADGGQPGFTAVLAVIALLAAALLAYRRD